MDTKIADDIRNSLIISNSQSWQPCLALFISMEGSIGFCGDALVKASCENERIIEGF